MTEIQSLSFEAAFDELEETVSQLELGELTLEQSLSLLSRGQALAAHCEAQLDAAELKVQQLLRSASGEAQVAPFELES